MVGIAEVIVDWTGPGRSPKLNVFYHPAENGVVNFRQNLDIWLTSVRDSLSQQYSWRIRQSGDVFEDSTGELVGEWSDSQARVGTGTLADQPVADATQVLVRWRTAQIVNGRRLRGRTFIPGVGNTKVVNGNLADGTVAVLNGFSKTFAQSANPPHIWHRPTGGTGGLAASTQSADVWKELATLRRRRG